MSLNLEQSQLAMEAAQRKAEELDIAVCIAVLDSGGRLMSFLRMDGSNWASIWGAQGKALTAAATRCRSGQIPPTSVVMGRIAELEGGNMIYAQGAVPLIREGVLLGAIGVGGASADLDEACAEAGALALGCDS
ncbi:GlcG/HbpS family heme-binding protein [Oceanicola sp. S124]|uniref:GlcG/HbpS family heme-binding protein n=1 Tax=Oceanicola sp. S124 TaxID=1042378 RepID=UPI00025584D8|nr:heme-binding protein [Oceanicola sp. S124]